MIEDILAVFPRLKTGFPFCKIKFQSILFYKFSKIILCNKVVVNKVASVFSGLVFMPRIDLIA